MLSWRRCVETLCSVLMCLQDNSGIHQVIGGAIVTTVNARAADALSISKTHKLSISNSRLKAQNSPISLRRRGASATSSHSPGQLGHLERDSQAEGEVS